MTEDEDEEKIEQTHCYTCGKPLGDVRFQCSTCDEWYCSEVCLLKHAFAMDNLS